MSSCPATACSSVQVKWVSKEEPWKGFEYLYLSDQDYQAAVERAGASQLPFRATAVPGGGGTAAVHWRLTDIIGSEDGVGVECLSGSAATAAAFSRGFERGFTITLVTGRTVGIGAYLARLGRRYAPTVLARVSAGTGKMRQIVHHYLRVDPWYTHTAFASSLFCGMLPGTGGMRAGLFSGLTSQLS